MTHSDFVHLHVHTQYSLLDGACHLDRLVERAAHFKLPALAITDHGNMFGAIKFYNLCVNKGIKPIIGCEVYIAPHSRFKKDYKQYEESNFHLVLLAKDDQGYRNLLRLTSLGYLEGFYYRPRIDKEILAQYSNGLIGTSACLKGEVAYAITKGNVNAAYKLADEYNHIFGKGNFYLEIMQNDLKEQKQVNEQLLKISKQLDIPVVATNDVHYLEPEQAFAHETLLAIQTQTTINDPGRFKFGSNTFYFRSPQEMKAIFKDTPQALKNTLEIMQKCNFVYDFSQVHLPKFPLPTKETENGYLKKVCFENIKKKYPDSAKETLQRLEYELSVIKRTGFASYFLIIWDLVKFAKESEIPVGPGRGSAAGSIVSYILGITDVDPLKYNLIFERFLNPERISMPDIDIDFCYEKRVQVLDYVGRRYGKDNVAQIITFGTMLARAVIRDVGRALDFSYAEVDKIAKMIPTAVGHNVNLREALKTSPELASIYDSDQKIKQLIDTAIQLEGLSRHASTHAAGVVISDRPLIERIPLTRGAEGEVITGFDMDSLVQTGLLKMDFLGLKTLTVINETLRIIKRTRGILLNIDTIELSDAKTFALLAKGDTIGVFQLESRGMREILKNINPTQFKDLIAVLALYRPGPLGSGMVQDFIERKTGVKPVTHMHPLLEPILKETYGIILYQEQTMQIASDLAGFSLSQADLLRKAIGKKIPEIMEEQKGRFVQGCRKNKIQEKTATLIFDLIDYFSGYGFNKSHSTAYALISYRTAYLKANYGVEFMAALLTSERNNTDKVVEYVHETNRRGIEVLPPDINESFANFTVTKDDNIRFGLMAIKNVGGAALENIISIRKEEKFASFSDFCHRVQTRTVNKKVIESLIKSGAMDSFGFKRAQMGLMLDKVLERASKKAKVPKNQLFLFETKPQEIEVPDVDEWPMNQILGFEKRLLGMYVSSHPLKEYENLIKLLDIKSITDLHDATMQQDVSLIGVVEKIKLITTRRDNQRMAIVRVEDQTQSVEVFVFPRTYERCFLHLAETKVVIIKGTLQLKDKIPKVLANDIIAIENIYKSIKRLNIAINGNGANLKRLKEIFISNKGDIPVCFILKNSRLHGVKIKAAQDFHLALSRPLLEEIQQAPGVGFVSLSL